LNYFVASPAFFSQQALVLSAAQAFDESSLQHCAESPLQQALVESHCSIAAALVSAASVSATCLPPQDITETENTTANAAINTFVFISINCLNVIIKNARQNYAKFYAYNQINAD
jgi:hypothetical protein